MYLSHKMCQKLPVTEYMCGTRLYNTASYYNYTSCTYEYTTYERQYILEDPTEALSLKRRGISQYSYTNYWCYDFLY